MCIQKRTYMHACAYTEFHRFVHIHTYIHYIHTYIRRQQRYRLRLRPGALVEFSMYKCMSVYTHIYIYICLLYAHIMCNGYIFCDFVQVHTLNSAYTYVCSYICSHTNFDNGCIYVHIHTWTMAASPATPTRYIHSTMSCHSFKCVMSHLCMRLAFQRIMSHSHSSFFWTRHVTHVNTLSPPPPLTLSIPATPNRFSPWESKALNSENLSRILLPWK